MIELNLINLDFLLLIFNILIQDLQFVTIKIILTFLFHLIILEVFVFKDLKYL